MAAFGSNSTGNSNCCTMAAAGTSAPMFSLLDTAIFLVVSISIALLRIPFGA